MKKKHHKDLVHLQNQAMERVFRTLQLQRETVEVLLNTLHVLMKTMYMNMKTLKASYSFFVIQICHLFC